jgi:hypothetical protein
MKNVKKIVELTREFLTIPSSINYEKPFLKYLQKRAKSLGYKTILEDTYLVVKPQDNPYTHTLFSAHIDRHSLIKNSEGELEYLAFYLKKQMSSKFKFEEIHDLEHDVVNKINQLENIKCQLRDDFFVIKENDKTLLKMERTGRKIFFESVGLRHTHEKIKSYNPNTGKILRSYETGRYDISIKDKKVIFDTIKPLKRGDNIFMFDSGINFNKKLISGQIDNVISAATIFVLMEERLFTQEAIFTTGEEIGESWKCIQDYYVKNNLLKKSKSTETLVDDMGLAFNKKLDLVVIDTSPYLGLDEKPRGFLTLRNGDERGGFDEKQFREIKRILKRKNIPIDLKPSDTGNTELGKLTKETKGKINGITLQLPTTNYHTTYETCTKESLKNYYRVIKKLNHIEESQVKQSKK